ncbi:SDR family NAD(P)-dependent oxidoreductase [Alteromonas confluentis]|uniref:Short-chain dehydrogenase n=1 Tax=Alteromonas confluentis TaxID=1656094 RepID=A0A1E7Z758_9ALTE|nr:SDR family oxidoreductase [Alteromonas confluentis]OFC69383.1 hypothetical protein BFC18_18385 [Alteromonas confluentis]
MSELQRKTPFAAGNVAVVTGGAKGLGAEAVKQFLSRNMQVIVIDNDDKALHKLQQVCQAPTLLTPVVADLTDENDLALAFSSITERVSEIHVLLNNAAVMTKTGFNDALSEWKSVFNVNVWAMLSLTQQLLPLMTSGAIINAGSKEGITTPPGQPAYSVAKASVKVLTELLQHELRNTKPDVSAHLLVPGFTHTPMNFPDGDTTSERARAAWPTSKVIELMITRVNRGDFYLWGLDKETTRSLDMARITWHYQDIIQNRPPLSRWHQQYKSDFVEFAEHFCTIE